MNQRKAFDRGLLAGVLIVVALDAVYWFISTWRPDTSRVQTILVAIQALVSIVGAVWLLLGRKRLSDSQ
jgi:type II secretory pathway component PulM